MLSFFKYLIALFIRPKPNTTDVNNICIDTENPITTEPDSADIDSTNTDIVPENNDKPLIKDTMKILNGADCLKKYGWGYDLLSTPDINEQHAFERKHMTLYVVPQKYRTEGKIPARIYCNKDLVKPLENAFENLLKAGLLAELKTWDGCFNPRPIRGYEKRFHDLIAQGKYDEAVKLLSIHSWGIAIDINAAENGLGVKPKLSAPFVACFKDAGFTWGGDFVGRPDGMHFQLTVI